MYHISVPIVFHERICLEDVLADLKQCHADRMFLAVSNVPASREKRQKLADRLEGAIRFFQQNGLETGVWFWTYVRDEDWKGFQWMQDGDGKEKVPFCCPADEKYRAEILDWVRMVAEKKPDILMFDDDFGMTFYLARGNGCFCPRHMKYYTQELGEEISREEFLAKIYDGGSNRWRDAFLRGKGKALEDFCHAIRETVDKIHPAMRVAVCSVMSLWDTDGIDSARVVKLLAGGTKPLLRLIGAPYWAADQSWGNRLQHVIELERMEASWCQGAEVEIMTEGDVYPRPRYQCPASYLECFDTALRAAGVADGIHKYMLDYTASTRMERGYLDRHCQNEAIYARIPEFFRGECAGVRVYEAMKKFADADLSGLTYKEKDDWVHNSFFSRAARMLSDLTVPTTYQGDGVTGIAFGENARHLPEEALGKGMILDGIAAKILSERGIDVGLEAFGEKFRPTELHFLRQEETVSGYNGEPAWELFPKQGAEVLISAQTKGTPTPCAYRYQNSTGQKFIVLGWDADRAGETWYRSYCMQELLMEGVEWLSGEKLPVQCRHNPDCYILCRRSEEGLSVGVWNLFADAMPAQELQLDRHYRGVEFLAGSGSLSGDRLTLSEVAPFSFALFRLQ